MLTVTARLLHGTLRAGSPHDTVMAGGAPEGEWPPSPARIFAALVAADGTRDRCRITTGDELRALEALPPPRILADASVEVSELRPRFVVKDSTAKNVVQNYPARTSTEVRPGVKMSPKMPVVAYAWDGDIESTYVASLGRRAARIGYLGCSDSPVEVRVSTDMPDVDLAEWLPGAARGTALPVPYAGFTDALDWAYDAWTAGQPMRRALVPNEWERYSCTDGLATDGAVPTIIWLEFGSPVPGRRSLAVTSTLRKAVLSAIEDSPQRASNDWQLHGHGVPDDVERPYQLARYLPLSDIGHRNAGGKVHGAAIWLPPSATAGLVENVRTAVVQKLSDLRGAGFRSSVRVRTGSSAKWSTDPTRWEGPARRWFSATPVVAERGRRGGPTDDDVRSWFQHAAHPEPDQIRISTVPTRPGVPRLSGNEVHRNGRDRHPYYWIEALFDSPVNGPLCIGRSRSFGMGLLAPDKKRGNR